MKKIVSLLLACVLLVGCALSLTSCSKFLMGEYKDDLTGNIKYEFTLFTYKKTVDNIIGDDTVTEGSFEIDEEAGTITFTYESDGEKKTQTEDYSYGEKEGVKYIKIGFLTYSEVK